MSCNVLHLLPYYLTVLPSEDQGLNQDTQMWAWSQHVNLG